MDGSHVQRTMRMNKYARKTAFHHGGEQQLRPLGTPCMVTMQPYAFSPTRTGPYSELMDWETRILPPARFVELRAIGTRQSMDSVREHGTSRL